LNSDETFTLTVNGQRYERWEEIRVTPEIGRMATDWAAGRTNGEEDDFAEEGDVVAGDAQIPVQTEVEGEARDPGVPWSWRKHGRRRCSARCGRRNTTRRAALWRVSSCPAVGSQMVHCGGSTNLSQSASHSCRWTWNCRLRA
jgi:hypothetical protein